MPFQKGRSGNPGGRSTEKPWREAIARAVKQRAEGKGSPQALDRLAKALVTAGLEGDVAAIKEIGDRLDGKSIQPNAHSGDGEGGPIEHGFRWLTADDGSK